MSLSSSFTLPTDSDTDLFLYLCSAASSADTSSSEFTLFWAPSECSFSYRSAISMRAWVKWQSCSDRWDRRSSREEEEDEEEVAGWLCRPMVTTFLSSLYSDV